MKWKRTMSIILAGTMLAATAAPAAVSTAAETETEIQTEAAESEDPETAEPETDWETETELLTEPESEVVVEETEAVTETAEEIPAAQFRSDEEPALIAHYSFEEDLTNGGITEDTATPLQTGLSEYSGSISYDNAGKEGSAVRLGSYGLRLNKKNIGSDYTVSMWVKPNTVPEENQNMLFLGYHAPEKWVAVSGNLSGGYKYWCNDAGDDNYNWKGMADIAPAVGEWSLVTVTQSGGQAKIYLNGIPAGSSTAPEVLSGSNQDIYLGVTFWDDEFDGLVDEVKVYDEVLSEEAIYDAYDDRTAAEVLQQEGIEVIDNLNIKEGGRKAIDVVIPYKARQAGAAASFETADDTIAIVDESGLVQGIGVGTTTVTTTVVLDDVSVDDVTTVTVTEADIPVDHNYAVRYDMKTVRDGNKLVDMSGHDSHATINNPSGVSFAQDGEDDVLSINNQNSYLSLPKSIISDLDSKEKFTVEVEYARAANSGANSWLWSFGANVKTTGDHYLFYCPAFGGSTGPVRAGIKNSATEKLLPLSIVNQDQQFYTATMVFDQGNIDLYIDGIKVSSLESGYSIVNDVINNGTTADILGYIGRSCWRGDTNFLGSLKSFKIYNGALSETEVQNVSLDKYQQILAQRLDEGIELEDILGKNEADNQIRYRLNLPAKLANMDLSWSADDEQIIKADGEVVNPEAATEVVLTARIESGSISAEKSFPLTVIPADKAVLTELLKTVKGLKKVNYTARSFAVLETAIAEAEAARSQEQVDTAYGRLEKAAGNLKFHEDYINPWDKIAAAAPPVRKTMKAGENAKMFELPAELKQMVSVSYASSNNAYAEYNSGTVKAKKAGKVTVTVLVKSNFNDFVMEYSTALNILNADKPIETEKPDETEAKQPEIKVGRVSGMKAVATVNSVKLSWKKLSGTDGYEVYRYNSASKKYTRIKTTGGTTYSDKKRKSATAYAYKIRAYKKVSGKTYYGDYTEYKTLTKPTSPTKVKIKRTTKVSSKSKATLSFKKVSRATAYHIYKYNKKTKKYTEAYRIKGKKLYQYNAKTKKYKKLRSVKIRKGIISCTLTKLNLKKEKNQKYVVKAAVTKSGYGTQMSKNSKSVKLK